MGLLPAESTNGHPVAATPPAGETLKTWVKYGNLVSMTRKTKSGTSKETESGRRRAHPRFGRWLLQDAKARFSELVRRVRTDGPQLVTVHGREVVVVISAEEFRRLKGNPTGKALVDVLQASPLDDIDIEPRRERLPVRDIAL
jgi:prevent-host-death family protein